MPPHWESCAPPCTLHRDSHPGDAFSDRRRAGPYAGFVHELTTNFVGRLRSRDPDAWFELWETFGPVLRSQLARWGRGRIGVETVQDLSQDTMIALAGAIDRHDPSRGARFSTWLYRIVYNLAVNETQRRRSLVSLDQPLGGEEGPSSLGELQVSESEEPSAELEREDVVSAVRLAIDSLPENQRMALILAKYHDTPYAEIAVVLDSSEKAIKSLVQIGRAHV